MPKSDVTVSTPRIAELIAVKSIHSISLVLALVPVPFMLYYMIALDLDMDWQSLFSALSLTAALCILIYVSARCVAWLLYAIVVPGVMWLLYIAVHGLAWLLRTIIVPGMVWLVAVALPLAASLLYTAGRSLARRLRNMNFRSVRAFR
jgi:hypothetical protein